MTDKPRSRWWLAVVTIILMVAGGAVTLGMLIVTLKLASGLTWSEVSVAASSRVVASSASSPQVTAQELALLNRGRGEILEPGRLAPAAAGTPAEDKISAETASGTVVNAMTAVATAVAAVTLILSVGTTWLAIRMKDIDDAIRRLEATDAAYAQKLDHAREREALNERVLQQLIDAKIALRIWIDGHSESPGRYSTLAELSAHLETLRSPSAAARFKAFSKLDALLPVNKVSAMPAVETYCRTCHELHGGSESSHNVWCKIFDPVERAAFRARTKKSGRDY